MLMSAAAPTLTRPVDIFLMPGDCFVGDQRYRVRTLLGSCVSVTLWHPQLRIGAMSHFLLPGDNRRHDDPRRHPGAERYADKPGIYGAGAMELLLEGLARLGVPAVQCQGKIFGGGAMFPRGPNLRDIGVENGAYARAMLQRHGIQIVSESLFGMGHRQLIFTIRNGEVLSRQVPPEPMPARRLREPQA